MRVLITRKLQGSIDGIRLDQFVPGCEYEVGTTVGNYLLAVKAATPTDDDSPAIVLSLDQRLFGAPARNAAPPAAAADRRRTQKKKPR